ncbi:MAG: ABC transporter permease [Bacteroidetes bacterium]|nr:ABC transporter permease [Bacteroidota bacterium]MCL2302675.1 ABC transporter permease [Lentimicrobiaceae bacterium]
MNKVKLIIAREYLTRVKKKSFIIMTILAPLLFAGLMVAPVIIAKKTMESQKQMSVLVIDENDFFINKLEDNAQSVFTYRSGDVNEFKKELTTGKYDAILHIVKGNTSLRANLFYEKDPPTRFAAGLERQLDKQLFDKLLMDTFNIQPKQFEMYKQATQATITSIRIDESGNEKASNADVSKIVGMVFGLIIYFLIFFSAQQVLRGVLEEKTNRIIEVLISSVKPVQLMLGKIIGVAMVGITQLVLWIVLTLILIVGVQFIAPDLFTGNPEMMQIAMQTQMNVGVENLQPLQTIGTEQSLAQNSVFEQIQNYFNISFTALILCFLFYFILGYLIYASLFAAVGAAVDSETDSQQFVLPVTIPLLFAIIMFVPITEDPNGALALWLSMIPLTSPVVMLMRLPAGVPLYELLASMALCIVFFFFCVWLAARIYRIGILMYGKKTTWKDLAKWIRY